MVLVSNSTKTAWSKAIKQYRSDVGRDLVINMHPSISDCSWCIYDPVNDRSSGRAETGFVWSTHPDYVSPYNDKICPNCSGRGRVTDTANTVTIKATRMHMDVDDREDTNAGSFEMDRLRVSVNLEDVIISGTDATSDTYFDRAISATYEGQDYQILNVDRVGIGTLVSCRIILERTNKR